MTTTTNLSSTILIFTLLLISTLSTCCKTCIPKPPACPPPPHKKPSPMAPPKTPPRTPPMSPPMANPSCPRDTLKLGACADLLGGLVNVIIGSSPSSQSQCCSLLQGLADLDAAVCLCTAIRANVLGINLNVPVTLSLLVNACERTLPRNFKCE